MVHLPGDFLQRDHYLSFVMVLFRCNELITTIIQDETARFAPAEHDLWRNVRAQLDDNFYAEKKKGKCSCVSALKQLLTLIVSYLALLHNWQLVN